MAILIKTGSLANLLGKQTLRISIRLVAVGRRQNVAQTRNHLKDRRIGPGIRKLVGLQCRLQQTLEREQQFARVDQPMSSAGTGQPLGIRVQQRKAIDVPALGMELLDPPGHGLNPLGQVAQKRLAEVFQAVCDFSSHKNS